MKEALEADSPLIGHWKRNIRVESASVFSIDYIPQLRARIATVSLKPISRTIREQSPALTIFHRQGQLPPGHALRPIKDIVTVSIATL